MECITGILMVISTLIILKDTHVRLYYRVHGDAKLVHEYDIKVQIWTAIVIVILGMLPIANQVLFSAFIIYYVVHSLWNPNECDYFTHVFSLRGDNFITRGLLRIKSLLCREI